MKKESLSMRRRRAKKEQKKKRMILWGKIAGLLLVCLLGACVFHIIRLGRMKDKQTTKVQDLSGKLVQPTGTAELEASQTPETTSDPTVGIYSYLQGPKSWSWGLDWSGEWGEKLMDGGSFGGFGCGLCCMANLYSSLTEYECSPVDMYHYTKKHTGYTGGSALSWGYMRRGLSQVGFDCCVKQKPDCYEDFRQEISGSRGAVVLVSSSDSKVYWKNTPGHYVTIFLYQQEKDLVFLADSGDPKHNRHWVELKKIYRSLKTASSWQYLLVQDYEKKNDAFRCKKASGNWHRPDYVKKK